MKTMVSPWTLAMAALLTAQTVVGFGMFDVLRASRQIKDSRRDIKAPADVIVDVVLEEADFNNDQQITLAEMETFFDGFPDSERHNPQFEDEKGYILAVSALIDTDQSGAVELDELQRAATTLVTQAGAIQVGRFIRGQVVIGMITGRFDPVVKAGEMAGDFLAALDTNHDGLVNGDETDRLLGTKGLRWGPREIIRRLKNETDQNGDGNLDQSETTQLLRLMAEEEPMFFRVCYIYVRIWKLTGAEIANNWMNS